MADSICSMPGCDRKSRSRGLCATHYTKAWRDGTLPPAESPDHWHSLSNVDKDNGTADCKVCGPSVSIRVRTLGGNKTSFECRTARHNRKRRDPNRFKYERARRLASYNLTQSDFDEMSDSQDGRCAICREEVAKLMVDHDHTTGVVRGLLCSGCNLGLGHFQDRASVLMAAAAYLQRSAE